MLFPFGFEQESRPLIPTAVLTAEQTLFINKSKLKSGECHPNTGGSTGPKRGCARPGWTAREEEKALPLLSHTKPTAALKALIE